MKGIILAGGSGTRLYPITKTISKQLLPVYDKPMIYYPLSVLMLAGIRDILIISTPKDLPRFKDLLGDGEDIGIKLKYEEQKEPKGIGEAFLIGEEFIGNDSVCLILGDNLFFGQDLPLILRKVKSEISGALIFAYYVKNPGAYGVVQVDNNWKAVSLEEKPKEPRSHLAVPGLYFYDNDVIGIAKNIKPSARGELEITDINKWYMKKDKLSVQYLGRGIAWLDTGSHEELIEAGNFVAAIQKRQGLYIACIEEIAYRMGYITKDNILKISNKMGKTEYGKYLRDLVNE